MWGERTAPHPLLLTLGLGLGRSSTGQSPEPPLDIANADPPPRVKHVPSRLPPEHRLVLGKKGENIKRVQRESGVLDLQVVRTQPSPPLPPTRRRHVSPR